MLNSEYLNKLIKDVANSLPPQLLSVKNEFENQMNQGLQLILSKLDLVTREEFDVQCEVLKRTRKKVEELERRLSFLEDAKQ